MVGLIAAGLGTEEPNLQTNIVDDMYLMAPRSARTVPDKSLEVKATSSPSLDDCSCVAYARKFIDFPRIKTPNDLQPNSVPCVGCAVLLSYGTLPHMGIITELRPGIVVYKDRRLYRGECQQQMRYISYENPRLRGFYR